MRRIIFLLLTGAIALGACSSGAPSFEDATSLIERLQNEGITCDEVEELPSGSLVEDSASCVTADGAIQIYVFGNEKDRDDWLKVGSSLRGVVTGPTWAVVAGKQAAEVKAATGGESL